MNELNPNDLILAASKIAEDVKIAAKVVSDAVHNAEIVREKAARDAAELLARAEKNTTLTLANALRETFGEQEESQRFIDTKRIPLICKDIEGIKNSVIKSQESIEKLHIKLDEKFVSKESFSPIQKIVYGAVAIILVAVFSALIYLVVSK